MWYKSDCLQKVLDVLLLIDILGKENNFIDLLNKNIKYSNIESLNN
jgi:hypothetical protein